MALYKSDYYYYYYYYYAFHANIVDYLYLVKEAMSFLEFVCLSVCVCLSVSLTLNLTSKLLIGSSSNVYQGCVCAFCGQ